MLANASVCPAIREHCSYLLYGRTLIVPAHFSRDSSPWSACSRVVQNDGRRGGSCIQHPTRPYIHSYRIFLLNRSNAQTRSFLQTLQLLMSNDQQHLIPTPASNILYLTSNILYPASRYGKLASPCRNLNRKYFSINTFVQSLKMFGTITANFLGLYR